jgi:hypothetical protein
MLGGEAGFLPGTFVKVWRWRLALAIVQATDDFNAADLNIHARDEDQRYSRWRPV